MRRLLSAGLMTVIALFSAGCARAVGPDPGRPPPPADFAMPSRETLAAEAGKGRFRVSIVSRAEATWRSADRAIWRGLGFRSGCIDADPKIDPERVPAVAEDELDTQTFPAGTTFSLTFGCEGPLPGEFEVGADVDEDAAIALVQSKLAGTGEFDDARHFIGPLEFGRGLRKYVAVDEAVGTHVTSALRHCESGQVALRQLVLATWPREPVAEGVHPLQRLVLGVEVECVAEPVIEGP